jgi:hypothetical protein
LTVATTGERQEKGGRNQALFRDVNERIEELTIADAVPTSETWEFLCECADTECVATISLTYDEYEAVRRTPTRFVVRPDHVYPEIERVIEENGGYVIVEKVGEGGKITAARDPRAREVPEAR